MFGLWLYIYFITIIFIYVCLGTYITIYYIFYLNDIYVALAIYSILAKQQRKFVKSKISCANIIIFINVNIILYMYIAFNVYEHSYIYIYIYVS